MVKTLIWSAAGALLLVTSPAWAALKIGYVNYPLLLQRSPQAQKVAAKIRAEFLPRQKALIKMQNALKASANKFQRDAATMTNDQRQKTQNSLEERDRDLQRRERDLQDALNAKRNEALSDLQHTLVRTVRTYAKTRHFDIVLADGVIYAKDGIDITPQILSRLQAAAHTASGGSGGHK